MCPATSLRPTFSSIECTTTTPSDEEDGAAVKKEEQDVAKKEEPNGAAATKDHELLQKLHSASHCQQVAPYSSRRSGLHTQLITRCRLQKDMTWK
jgi:hypothetical protein